MILNRKLANVVEVFLQQVPSLHQLFINDKVGCVDKCMQVITFRRKFFCGFFFDYEVDFYFKIPNPEIRNQMLMIICFKIFLLTQHLDYSMSTSGTDTSHNRSTN